MEVMSCFFRVHKPDIGLYPEVEVDATDILSSRSSVLYTEEVSSNCEFLAVKLTSIFQGKRASKYLPPHMEDLKINAMLAQRNRYKRTQMFQPTLLQLQG